MKKYLGILLAGLAMFAFVAVSCGGDDDTTADGDSDVADEDMDDGDSDVADGDMDDGDTADGDMDDSDMDDGDHDDGEMDSDTDMGDADVSITLIPLDDFTFETPELNVKVGESIRLTLDNSNGSTLHDFTIRMMPADDVHAEGAEHEMDDMDMVAVHVAADAGEVGVVTFTPTEAGTYEFECSAGDGSHKAAGMIGTIVVS